MAAIPKLLKCYDCDQTFTREEVFGAMEDLVPGYCQHRSVASHTGTAFKTKVFKNAYKKNLGQKFKFDSKNMHNVGSKYLNFDILVIGKKCFFFKKFLFHTKKFPWFPHRKT